MTHHGRGIEIVWDEQSGIFHGSSSKNPQADPDLEIIDEVLREFPRYYQLFFYSIKRRIIYYISEREKNYHTIESVLPLYFSIGPLYHGDPELQRIEDAKIKFLINILHQIKGDKRKFLNECLKGLKSLELSWIGLNRFNAKMFLLDASFIIHVISESNKCQGRQHYWMEIDLSEDEITYMKKSSSLSELLLFENQIPFEMINFIWKLVEKYKSNVGRGEQEEGYSQSLINGILNLFDLNEALNQHEQFQVSIDEVRNEPARQYRNLLDFYHQFLPIAKTPDAFYHRFLPSSIIDFHTSNDRVQRETIPSARELEKVGCVKFQLKKVHTYNINSFMAITFEDGNLYFPLTNLSIARKEILRSLLQFEYEELRLFQQNNSTNPPFEYKVFPYIYFMSCLLRNGEDVEILMKADIFDNEIGSMEDIAKFFSDLWRPYKFENSMKFPIFKYTKAINKCHNSKWKIFRAAIKRNFFANPLLIFSVFSAFQILVLTYIQVIQAFK